MIVEVVRRGLAVPNPRGDGGRLPTAVDSRRPAAALSAPFTQKCGGLLHKQNWLPKLHLRRDFWSIYEADSAPGGVRHLCYARGDNSGYLPTIRF